MSSMVATGSSLEEIREEVSEPWREMDFLFRVRFRSSRKLGWKLTSVLLFGEVGGIWEVGGTEGTALGAKGCSGICWGGGESASCSGGPLLRRCIVGGGVFFRELDFQEVVLAMPGCCWWCCCC